MNTDTIVKISVIIPVYNVEKYLSRCLDSVLRQSLREIEVICVDDCTPNGSAAIINSYVQRDSRVKAIHKAQNEGPMKARESGYDMACGEYLFFCDGDDLLPPDALSMLYNSAKESGADITVGNAEMVGESGKKVPRHRATRVGSDYRSYIRFILNWGTPALWGILFRRSLFEGVRYTAEKHMKLSEDRRLLTEILMLRQPTVHGLDRVVYWYWINPASSTRTKINEKAVIGQFKSLYGSYEFIEERSSEFTHCNDNQMIRYLSLYLEKGARPDLLKSIHPDIKRQLGYRHMANVCGTRFATHTFLCMHSAVYRYVVSSARIIIRRLQGKE